MKCLIVLSVLAVSCVLAQNYNDGRYYPELYASKFDDGKWRPDNSGAYRGRTGAYKTSSKGIGSRFVGASFIGNGLTATSSFGDSFGAASNSGSINPFSSGGSSSFSNPKKTKTGFVDSSNANKIGIKEDTRQLNEDGSYHYKVVNENDIEVSETGRVDNVGTDDELLRVMGYYQYLGDDGVLYRVDYVADENGFRPLGAHLPTPPPIPEKILKSLQARGLARK